MKLSIVIPVYNVERYVAECIHSVLDRQDINSLDVEIIVVNDGTKDNSLEIVNQLLNGKNNAIVYSQENKGLSEARNKGLELSTGDWVWFVDADDVIDKNSFKLLSPILLRQEIDAITFSQKEWTDNSTYYAHNYEKYDTQVLSGIEMIKKGIWSKEVPYTIYRTSFLRSNKLKMVPAIYHEDAEFSPRSYYLLKKIYILGNVLYYRRENPSSITHIFNIKRIYDILFVSDSIYKFSKDFRDKNERSLYQGLVAQYLNSALNLLRDASADDIEQVEKEIRKKRYLFRYMKGSSTKRYALAGNLYYMFPNYVIPIYKIFNKISNLL